MRKLLNIGLNVGWEMNWLYDEAITLEKEMRVNRLEI
jgi:hypothetical protein